MKAALKWLMIPFVLLSLAGCPQTEFYDDFEDGVLHPAYRLFPEDPSGVSEHDGILEGSSAMIALESIPGDPFPLAPTEITAGVDLSLDIVDHSPNAIVLLTLLDNALDPQDLYSIGLFLSIPMCMDEEETGTPEGVYLSTPITVSIQCDEDGTVTGYFSDESGTYACPLVSSIADVPLDASMSMTGRLYPGYAAVDNFSVSLLQ